MHPYLLNFRQIEQWLERHPESHLNRREVGRAKVVTIVAEVLLNRFTMRFIMIIDKNPQ